MTQCTTTVTIEFSSTTTEVDRKGSTTETKKKEILTNIIGEGPNTIHKATKGTTDTNYEKNFAGIPPKNFHPTKRPATYAVIGYDSSSTRSF